MKNIVVTGATSGIGREVAYQLLKLGHRVISNTRNPEKSQMVKTTLISETQNNNLVFIEADFGDFSSVRHFAGEIRKHFDSLDVLINNAGTWEMSFRETRDGIETNLQVNHLSPMLLTLELLPLLQKSGNARIINTSSGAHRRDICDFNDIEWRNKAYDGIATYSQSKLFNILFTRQLASRVSGEGITVNTVHPGYVKTALFNKMEMRSWDGVPSAGEGARSALYAALDPAMEGVSGKYIFHESEDPNLSGLAEDDRLAARLWDISMKYIAPYLSIRQ